MAVISYTFSLHNSFWTCIYIDARYSEYKLNADFIHFSSGIVDKEQPHCFLCRTHPRSYFRLSFSLKETFCYSCQEKVQREKDTCYPQTITSKERDNTAT